MLLTDARRDARLDADGRMIRLADQDREKWNRSRIAEGHEIVRACLRRNQPGMFQIQAAIAAVHADAAIAAATDWRQVVALYDQLYALRPDPVVAINRAVAIGALDGAGAGVLALELIDADAVATYQPFHAARADMLARCGRTDEADIAYGRAIELTDNPVERRFLEEQRTSSVN
jgi:RNA polymerase sigma-70 factor (ECF subfamily)